MYLGRFCDSDAFFSAVNADNRWNPITDVGSGADTLNLKHDLPSAQYQQQQQPSHQQRYPDEQQLSGSSPSLSFELPSSSEWWVRQDRSNDEYTLAHDADGDGNVDLYDMSRIDHDVEMAPPEGARRLDTFGDDVYVYEVLCQVAFETETHILSCQRFEMLRIRTSFERDIFSTVKTGHLSETNSARCES